MVLKVTFDTNVLNELFNENRRCEVFRVEILKSILDGRLKAYFSDSLVILEGIQRKYRSDIFGSRKISSTYSGDIRSGITISIGASMQKPVIHSEHDKFVRLLVENRFRALRGIAYLGNNHVHHLDFDIYEDISIEDLVAAREIMQDVEVSITRRNLVTGLKVGKCRARELGLMWLAREHLKEGFLWEAGLGFAKTEKEKKQAANAVAEWADAELVIRHIGYKNDYLCSRDCGKGCGSDASIFDNSHREWLSSLYGVNVVTPEELQSLLTHQTG